MKRGFVVVVLLLCVCTPGVFADFDDLVYSSDVVISDDVGFTFILTNTSSMVSLSTGENTIISKGKCKSVSIFIVCIETVTIDECESDTVCKIDPATLQPRTFGEVNISVVRPALEVTRTSTSSSAAIGEWITFDVEITNTGNTKATQIEFTDEFPSSVVVQPGYDVTVIGNKIKTTRFILNPGQTKTFSYKIRGTQELTTSLAGSYEYVFNGGIYKEVTDAIQTTIVTPLTIIISPSSTSVLENTTSSAIITIKNNIQKSITVSSFTLNGTTLTKSDDLDLKNGIYTWSGSIDENENTTFNVSYKVTSNIALRANAQYVFGGATGLATTTAAITKTLPAQAAAQEDLLDLALFTDHAQVPAYGKNRVVALLNLLTDTSVNNITLALSSTYNATKNTTISIDKISSAIGVEYGKLYFTFGNLENRTTITVTAFVTYTGNNTKQNQTLVKTFTVLPLSEVIGITTTLTTVTDAITQTRIDTTFANKLADYPLSDILTEQKLTDGLLAKNKYLTDTITLDGGESKLLFSTTVTVPYSKINQSVFSKATYLYAATNKTTPFVATNQVESNATLTIKTPESASLGDFFETTIAFTSPSVAASDIFIQIVPLSGFEVAGNLTYSLSNSQKGESLTLKVIARGVNAFTNQPYNIDLFYKTQDGQYYAQKGASNVTILQKAPTNEIIYTHGTIYANYTIFTFKASMLTSPIVRLYSTTWNSTVDISKTPIYIGRHVSLLDPIYITYSVGTLFVTSTVVLDIIYINETLLLLQNASQNAINNQTQQELKAPNADKSNIIPGFRIPSWVIFGVLALAGLIIVISAIKRLQAQV